MQNEHKLKANVKREKDTNRPYRDRIVNGVKRRSYLIWITETSLTKSDMAEDCDVNRIMKQHTQGGKNLNPLNKQGIYGDFTNLPDFQTSLDTVIQAREEFNELTSHQRNYFENNPQKLVDFLGDKNNKQKAIDLGLIDQPPKIRKPEEPKPSVSTPKKPATPSVDEPPMAE